MPDFRNLTEAITRGDRNEATRLTQEAIDGDTEANVILDAMTAGMDHIGQRFKENKAFVPELLIASRAMKESMTLLEPLLLKAGIAPAFTTVIGTVEGDLHDIGKNLVAMMWKGANFGVVDLGTNVPADKFVEAARQHQAKVVGLSALLTTTMDGMRTTAEAIRAAGLDSVKIIIGGAPITPKFADKIGADGYAADAASAVDTVREVLAA